MKYSRYFELLAGKLSAAVFVIVAAALLTLSCASEGPVVPVPPTVRVTRLNSTVITPDVVKFQAKILINNNMRARVDFDKVDYGVNLFDKPLFSETFNGMKPTNPNGTETVTFPFQISMKDILAQDVALLAEGQLRVEFHGTVFPAVESGFAPMRFSDTVLIPIPKIPTLSFEGTEGSLVGRQFSVRLRMHNPNDFAMSVDSVDSYLDLNGQRYTLLHSQQESDIPANGSGSVTLTMENSVGKTLSFALNALQANSAKFTVGGTIVCNTPYGWIYIPVGVAGSSQ
ncbi:LEA type 2 family protein [Salinispira pacifica]